jgi:tetratricopeptide (TPR) repeat protein
VIEAWSGEIQEGEDQWWEKHELLASSDDRTTYRASAGTEAAPVLWWNGKERKGGQAAPVTLVVAHWPGQCGCGAEEFEIEVFLDTLETAAEAPSTAGPDAGGTATDPPVQGDAPELPVGRPGTREWRNGAGDLVAAGEFVELAGSAVTIATTEDERVDIPLTELAEGDAAIAKRSQAELLMRQALQLYEFEGDEGAAAAVHLLTSASELDARDHRAVFLTGMILAIRYEDFQEASARFKSAVDRNGEHVPSVNNLAVALARSERVSEALPLFWKAYEGDRDNLQIHHNARRLPLYELTESEHTSVMRLFSALTAHALTRGITSEGKENGRKAFVLLPLLRGELEVAESEEPMAGGRTQQDSEG